MEEKKKLGEERCGSGTKRWSMTPRREEKTMEVRERRLGCEKEDEVQKVKKIFVICNVKNILDRLFFFNRSNMYILDRFFL